MNLKIPLVIPCPSKKGMVIYCMQDKILQIKSRLIDYVVIGVENLRRTYCSCGIDMLPWVVKGIVGTSLDPALSM